MLLSTKTVGSGTRSAALVHGASASGEIWRDFAAILVESYDFTVTLVDLRGHGDSPRATAIGSVTSSATSSTHFPWGSTSSSANRSGVAPACWPLRS